MRRERSSRRRGLALARALAVVGLGALAGTAGAAAPQYTTRFALDECTFSSTGRNLHFSIRPADRLVLEGVEDGEVVRLQITVLRQTKQITFVTGEGESVTVTARVVEEREWRSGKLAEVSRNFYARCIQTGDVFYLGEEVDIYDEEGQIIVSNDGAWLAGEDGALPGLIMPGTFLLGSRYFQERASPVALDRAEHTRMGLTVRARAGTFKDCVEVKETTPLEPGAVSMKVYCPEIGLVVDDTAELVEFDVAGADGEDD